MQANLVVQEARLNVAAAELSSAQAQLDDKQRELDKVQAMYDGAVREKQVITYTLRQYRTLPARITIYCHSLIVIACHPYFLINVCYL